MTYKLSKYNVVSEEGNGYVLANTLSRACLPLEEEQWKYLQPFIKADQNLDHADNELIDFLYDNRALSIHPML